MSCARQNDFEGNEGEQYLLCCCFTADLHVTAALLLLYCCFNADLHVAAALLLL
jgi:hypothetical protein